MAKRKRNAATHPSAQHSLHALRLPLTFYRKGAALFDQQMWFWGCDVRREAGNLLLEYGCIKRPSPVPHYRSAYTYWLNDESALTLWGWGVWLSQVNTGSLFLSRARFRVHSSETVMLLPEAGCEKELPPHVDALHDQTSLHLLDKALRWIAQYETWANEQLPPQDRQQQAEHWPQRRRFQGGVDPNSLAQHWLALLEHVQTAPQSA